MQVNAQGEDPVDRTEAERLGDLLEKATSGPDPEVSNLTPDEEEELRALWASQGYDELLGPYDHPERWAELSSTPLLPPTAGEHPAMSYTTRHHADDSMKATELTVVRECQDGQGQEARDL